MAQLGDSLAVIVLEPFSLLRHSLLIDLVVSL